MLEILNVRSVEKGLLIEAILTDTPTPTQVLKITNARSVGKDLPKVAILIHILSSMLVKESLSVIFVASVSLPRVVLPATFKHIAK